MGKHSRVSSPFLGTTPISDQLQVNKTHNILACKSLASFDTPSTHDGQRYSSDVSCCIGGQKATASPMLRGKLMRLKGMALTLSVISS